VTLRVVNQDGYAHAFDIGGGAEPGPVIPLVSALCVIPAVIFVLLPFIFPDGRFVPHWTKWALLPLLVLTVTASSLPALGVPVTTTSYSLMLLLAFGVWLVAAADAFIFRYRRVSSPAQRQQTQWVVGDLLVTRPSPASSRRWRWWRRRW
jgi:hypothetical protein